MKKLIAMMTIALAATVPMASVSAKESKAVCIQLENITWNENTLEVPIQSDGSVTDGVLEITYDPKVLSIDEAAIELGEQVDMYSVNITEGTVKISYLAEEAIPAGDFITLDFQALEEVSPDEAKEALTGMTGTNYDQEGKEVSAGIVDEVQEEPGDGPNDEPDNGDTDTDADSDKTPDSDTSVSTGDSMNVTIPMLLACACVGVCGMEAHKISTKRKEEV